MQEFGRLLLLAAAILAAIGGLLLVAGRLGLGKLPGDIVIRGRHITVYVPIVTCALLSLFLSLLLQVLGGRRP
jgi:hypothetical protein